MIDSAAPSSNELAVGVSGHRKLCSDPRVGHYVHARCVALLGHLSALAEAQGTQLVAYSALATGADTLFAQAALGLGVPLVGVIPFADYPDDFEGEDRTQFERLRSLCREVHTLRRRSRSDQAYLEGGRWVVNHTDILIAVWNGLPAAGKGGTGDIVEFARSKQQMVLRIDPRAAPLPESAVAAAPVRRRA